MIESTDEGDKDKAERTLEGDPAAPAVPRGAELVIEDSEAAQEADAVAQERQPERPASLGGAIAGGAAGALVGAGIWALLMKLTGMELGLVAIGVGLLCGFGVLKLGGSGPTHQLIGAASALVGIVLGRVFFYYLGFDAMFIEELQKEGVPAEQARWALEMAKDAGVVNLWVYLKESLQPLDIVFFAIGAFEGWRIPRRAD